MSFMIGTELEFVECDVCRESPGSPELCRGCLHNREVIGRLWKRSDKFLQALKRVRDWTSLEHIHSVAADALLEMEHGYVCPQCGYKGFPSVHGNYCTACANAKRFAT